MVESTRPKATGAKVLARQTKGEITYAAKAMSTARGTGGEGGGKRMREEAQGDDSNQKASKTRWRIRGEERGGARRIEAMPGEARRRGWERGKRCREGKEGREEREHQG